MTDTEEGEKPLYTAEELENSVPVDWDRRLRGPAGAALRQSILDGLAALEQRQRRRQPAAQESWETTVEALAANLLALVRTQGDSDRFLGVSFNRNSYTGSGVSHDAAAKFRDLGRAAGWLEVAGGFQKPDGYGRRTRIRAAGTLLELFDGTHASARNVSRSASGLLRLRKAKERVPPPEHVEASRALLERLNGRLAALRIELPQEQWDRLSAIVEPDDGSPADDKRRHQKYARDLSATSLYRVFNGAWDRGGRMYGGWWMSLPKALRPHLTINGKATVERDYAQLHPTLLYARTGVMVPQDVYGLSAFEGPHVREVAKRTFARLVNSKKRVTRAHKDDRGLLPRRVRFRDFLSDFEGKLYDISQWFGVGEGLALQFEDSELALSVLERLDAAGIDALPIHDSFIVQEEHDLELQAAMHAAFVERYEHAPRIK
jgi:hypothetical protein